MSTHSNPLEIKSGSILLGWISRELFGRTRLNIKQIRWPSSGSYLQRRIARNGQLAISCPRHLLHCLTDSDPLCIPFIGQSLRHDGPRTLKQPHSGLSSIWPRSPRSTRIWSNAMKLVIGHELWSEKCLITYNSFRNAIVLLCPLTESSQGLGRFQIGESRSPQKIRGTINDD